MALGNLAIKTEPPGKHEHYAVSGDTPTNDEGAIVVES
jgi:hypothetical protein